MIHKNLTAYAGSSFQQKLSCKAAFELGGDDLSGAGDEGLGVLGCHGGCVSGLEGGRNHKIELMPNLSYSCEANKGMTYKMKRTLRHLVIFGILCTVTLTTTEQAKAESTYNASCKALGDGITLTRTGEVVLEQRLVKCKPIETYKAQSGQHGVCIIKKDPPGYRWISCWKKDGRYVTGDWDYAIRISPKEAVANAVQHRGWSGACKVKL